MGDIESERPAHINIVQDGENGDVDETDNIANGPSENEATTSQTPSTSGSRVPLSAKNSVDGLLEQREEKVWTSNGRSTNNSTVVPYQILRLEEENRKLKSALAQKSLDYDEMVREIERHIELVEKLQFKLSSYESRRKEQKSKSQSETQRKKMVAPYNSEFTTTSSGAERVGGGSRLVNGSKLPNHLATSMFGNNQSPLMVPANPEDICAALSCFVEENRMNFTPNFGSDSFNAANLTAQGKYCVPFVGICSRQE